MKKVSFALVFVFLFAFSCSSAEASLLSVDPRGVIEWNVLAYESDAPEVVVRQVMDTRPSSGLISLNNKNGSFKLVVSEGNTEKQLDVNNYQEQLIEVEATNAPEKMSISIDNGELTILQNGINAKTDLPLNLDTKGKKLGFETSSGVQYLTILPSDAVNSLVRANVISILPKDGKIRINQVEDGSLAYSVQGEREIKIANIVNIPVEVRASVSASSGNILKVDQPLWASVLNLIFS